MKNNNRPPIHMFCFNGFNSFMVIYIQIISCFLFWSSRKTEHSCASYGDSLIYHKYPNKKIFLYWVVPFTKGYIGTLCYIMNTHRQWFLYWLVSFSTDYTSTSWYIKRTHRQWFLYWLVPSRTDYTSCYIIHIQRQWGSYSMVPGWFFLQSTGTSCYIIHTNCQ